MILVLVEGFRASQEPRERCTLHRSRYRQSRELEQRRRDVHELDQRIARGAPQQARWPREHEGHAHETFEEAAALVDQAMVAEQLAVVTHEDDDRAVELARRFERLKNQP